MVQPGQKRTADVFETWTDPDWNPVRLWVEKLDAIIGMVSYDADNAASALGVFRGPVGHFVHCSTILTYDGPPFSEISFDETARRI